MFNRTVVAVSTSVLLVLSGGIAQASTSPGLSTKRADLLKAHNDTRKKKCGADSLSLGKGGLGKAAMYHADDMADENYLAHDSQNPKEAWADRIDRFTGYDVGVENVGGGQKTVTEIMTGWMNSPGHKRNLMDCNFKHVGFGYAYTENSKHGHYWVADFAY